MKVVEVVELLKEKGITMTRQNVYTLAHKYSLFTPKGDSTLQPGLQLDPKKAKDLVEVLSSDLLLSNIASINDTTLSQVDYYIRKGYIHTTEKYGRKLLKNKKDLEYVTKQLQK